MANLSSAIKDTVPITLFNRGMAGKIFDDVKRNGAKVVMKNNVAECILLSPDEYLDIMERLEDEMLLKVANERMANPTNLYDSKDVYDEFGIVAEDLEDYECTEIE